MDNRQLQSCGGHLPKCGEQGREREMEKLIASIKSDFVSELSFRDQEAKDVIKFRAQVVKIASEINNRTAFGEKVPPKLFKDLEKATKKRDEAERKIDEIKNNRIYENAFEWRFEFPEVLNDDGDFIGFDVVIGNPPYGVSFSEYEKEYLKNHFISTSGEVEIYTYFIELAITKLLKKKGYFSYITTNTVYYLNKFAPIRKKAFLDNRIISLLELEKQVFADAPDIVPAIYVLQKSNCSNHIVTLYKSQETKRVYDLVSLEGFNTNKIEQDKFQGKSDYVFNLTTNESKENLLNKLSQLDPLKKFYKTVYGIKTGNNYSISARGILANKQDYLAHPSDETDKKVFVGNLDRYFLDKKYCFIKYGENLREKPKSYDFFIGERILIRRIINRRFRIMATFTNEEFICKKDIYILKITDSGIDYKYVLGLLNSKLISYYKTKSSGSAKKDDFTQITLRDIRQLPIPESKNEITNQISEKVKDLLEKKKSQVDTGDLENQIDQLVYQLYGLKGEEIAIVEGV